ncbi:MAG TPA: VOC family protein [Burkholderiales bacterium]|nr:VOC family protein [Burkholderiales bacterium]
MNLPRLGALQGDVIQVAYFVENVEQSMQTFSERLNIGPWFVSGPFTPARGLYRGKPTRMRVTLAVGYGGPMMFELIEQHDNEPSVFQEALAGHGYGFHHWGVATRAFDEAVARYEALGYEQAFFDHSPRGGRVAYMDATRQLPGMIELIEMTEKKEANNMEIYHASLGWDGSDPIRRAMIA